MTEFDAESREGCKCVDDEPTAVAGVVIALIRIWPYLDGTVDADQVTDPLIFPPSVCSASFRSGWRLTERTPRECLLCHDSSPVTSSRAAVQP